MKPLEIDVARVGRAAVKCDELDEARAPLAERMAAYAVLARACDLAAENARKVSAG